MYKMICKTGMASVCESPQGDSLHPWLQAGSWVLKIPSQPRDVSAETHLTWDLAAAYAKAIYSRKSSFSASKVLDFLERSYGLAKPVSAGGWALFGGAPAAARGLSFSCRKGRAGPRPLARGAPTPQETAQARRRCGKGLRSSGKRWFRSFFTENKNGLTRKKAVKLLSFHLHKVMQITVQGSQGEPES